MKFTEMWFSFRGTCSRKDYWLTGILPLLAIAPIGPVLWYSLALLGIIGRETYYSGLTIVIVTEIGLLLWPYLAIHRKRMRDAGLSGIWTLLIIMPWTAPAAIPILGLLPGKKETPYQDPGKSSRTGLKVIAIATTLILAAAAGIFVMISLNGSTNEGNKAQNIPSPTLIPNGFPTLTPDRALLPAPDAVPTLAPDNFIQYGDKDWFFGETSSLIVEAESLLKEDKYEEALERYKKAQNIHGDPSRVIQNGIGLTYLAMGQPEEAIKHFSISIQTEDSRQDRLNRAAMYTRLHHCAEAVTDINAALLMDPEKDEPIGVKIGAHALAATCYIEMENYSMAENHRQSGLKLAEANNYSGEITKSLVDLEEAIKWLIEGEIYPEDLMEGQALTEYTAGQDLFLEGRYEEALVRLKSTQSLLERPSSRLEELIGAAYLWLDQHDRAIFHFNRAIEIRDDSYNRSSRSDAYLAQGNCTAAINDAVALLTMKPYVEPGYHSLAEAHFTIGLCKYEEENYDEGIEHFNKGLEIAVLNGYGPEGTEDYITLIEQANELINQPPVLEPAPAP